MFNTKRSVINHNILEPIPSTAKRQTEWDLGTKNTNHVTEAGMT